MKMNKKPCITTKRLINRGKRNKTLSEVKLVKNIGKNLQRFLEISPVLHTYKTMHKITPHKEIARIN